MILFRFNNQVCRSNFPSKVPELLSCGLFIIANNVGDFFDYLEDGKDSIRIQENTVESCVAALLNALSLNEIERKRLSENAVTSAYEKFNYKRYSQSLTDFVK